MANEVRQLAKGSSEAAEEITRVLKANADLVERTHSAVTEVIEHGQSNSANIGEIETMVHEILRGARNISTSVERLTQRSA